MTIFLQRDGCIYDIDLSSGIDLSLPLRSGAENPNAFGAPLPVFSPVRVGSFVGSTAEGSPVNFYNVFFNPHGNGTHTECVGHIAQERYVLHDCLKEFHFWAKLVSLSPQACANGDQLLLCEQIETVLKPFEVDALVVRTLPNTSEKRQRQYTRTNPPYLQAEAASLLAEYGIRHLLIDLPSIDREEDGGVSPLIRPSGDTLKLYAATAPLLNSFTYPMKCQMAFTG